jgi:hypothetical protein
VIIKEIPTTNMEADDTLEIDTVWREINPRGKFQMFQMFLILLDYMPACFAILSAVLTGKIFV